MCLEMCWGQTRRRGIARTSHLLSIPSSCVSLHLLLPSLHLPLPSSAPPPLCPQLLEAVVVEAVGGAMAALQRLTDGVALLDMLVRGVGGGHGLRGTG